jgi:hypothetical protein
MATNSFDNVVLAGHIGVDSGQIMIGDPCYLDGWDDNKDEEWNTEGKEGQYSYQGVSATTIKDNYGSIGGGLAVAMSSGYGDGQYPVYVQLNEDGRVVMAVIDFNDVLLGN